MKESIVLCKIKMTPMNLKMNEFLVLPDGIINNQFAFSCDNYIEIMIYKYKACHCRVEIPAGVDWGPSRGPSGGSSVRGSGGIILKHFSSKVLAISGNYN